MTKGYVGRILEVNLPTKQAAAIDLEERVVQNLLGGVGLGVKALYDEVGPNVHPLSRLPPFGFKTVLTSAVFPISSSLPADTWR